MRKRSKIGLGCLAIIVLLVAAAAWFWFSREPRPIVVAAPGAGGERVMLGDAPANFYAPAGDGPHPAILLLGGSEGGLKETRNVHARRLAAEGYAVLYPGYFETDEGNRGFEMVPLETFDAALAWLRARPNVDPERIGVIGHSKGAEAALLLASTRPGIRAVVAAMPSDVVWQGFDFQSMDMSKLSSSWSQGGEPVPFVPYVLPAWYEWITGTALSDMFRASWQAAGDYPRAAIPLRQASAPILLICAGQDLVWPSCDMARAAQERLADSNRTAPTLLAYPDAGHWAFGAVEGLHESDAGLLGKMGGTAETDMAARRDQWPKILAFLRENLGR